MEVGSTGGPAPLTIARMTTNDETPPPPPAADELPPTSLAGLVAAAKEKMLAAKVDRHGPAALKAMAAVVRDLKGMPELSISRETSTRLKLSRKGKVGFITIEYDPAILTIEVSAGGFSDAREPGAPKSQRYSLQGEEWTHMEGGGDLFGEIKTALIRLYPELAHAE
jgi:hypothetical protein